MKIQLPKMSKNFHKRPKTLAENVHRNCLTSIKRIFDMDNKKCAQETIQD